MRWWHGTVARLRLLFARRAADARMDEEFRFHLDMEADRLVREQGLAPDEARRRAFVAFGGVQEHREALRDEHGLAWLDRLSLDLKLGLRMLVKYPGLTTVGVIGMGMTVAIAAMTFTFIEVISGPELPLPEGDRILGIRLWDRRAVNVAPSTVHELTAWQEQLHSMEEVGAFRSGPRNLIVPDRPIAPVEVAEMTASAFRLTQVAPLLGRYFVEQDERPGTPRVVVIGYRLWQSHFDRDPAVIGRRLHLGSTEHTIVGVMPDGFAFPMKHQVWTPLRVELLKTPGGRGLSIWVFGRLTPRTTPEAAQADLSALWRRLAAAAPATYADLEARLVEFPALVSIVAEDGSEDLAFIRLLSILLLVVVCVNVGTLVYARTATREREIAIRASLGASRGRIIGQLLAEALVLSAAASAAGLAVALVAYRALHRLLADSDVMVPFWIPAHLSSGTLAHVALLTILAGAIIGLLPARQASGRGVMPTLSQLASGASIRLGRAWMLLIIGQVAAAMAILPGVVYFSASFGWSAFVPPGFPAQEYLTAEIEYGGTTLDRRRERTQRLPTSLTRLESRLEREPAVTGVTMSSRYPGQESSVRMEVESVTGDTSARPGQALRTMAVAGDFFETFGLRLLAGRTFAASDTAGDAPPVIVNEAFVSDVLGGRNALGRHIRLIDQRRGSTGDIRRGPWRDIVGVVPTFPPNRMEPDLERQYRAGVPDQSRLSQARVYEPLMAVRTVPVVLTAHLRSSPTEFTEPLRRIAADVDPELHMDEVEPLDAIYRQGERALVRMAALALGLVTVGVLALSAAGMYALMSFTVTRRRREIGIRAALGGQSRRITVSVLAQALRQLVLGACGGMLIALWLERWTGGLFMGGRAAIVLPAMLTMMVITGGLAALGPARRSLRVHPAEALKAE
jgi:predicted permease